MTRRSRRGAIIADGGHPRVVSGAPAVIGGFPGHVGNRGIVVRTPGPPGGNEGDSQPRTAFQSTRRGFFRAFAPFHPRGSHSEYCGERSYPSPVYDAGLRGVAAGKKKAPSSRRRTAPRSTAAQAACKTVNTTKPIPLFRRLIFRFSAILQPACRRLNTSFMDKTKPIVWPPRRKAIDCFLRTQMDGDSLGLFSLILTPYPVQTSRFGNWACITTLGCFTRPKGHANSVWPSCFRPAPQTEAKHKKRGSQARKQKNRRRKKAKPTRSMSSPGARGAA